MKNDHFSVTLSFMDLTALLDQIDRGSPADSLESDRIEFKQCDPSVKRTLEILADAVVCLVNAQGGHIILGVADVGGGPSAVTGVPADYTVDIVARGVFNRTRPPLSVAVDEMLHGSQRVMHLTIPKGVTFYSNAKGTSTRRVGGECRPFPPEEQRQALASRGLYDWSGQPSAGDVADLDPVEMARLRRLLSVAGKSEIARQEDARLLTELRLLIDGILTWAGLLLLGTGDALARLLPTYGYGYQYRQSPGAESGSRLREARPILAAVEQLIDVIESRRAVHPLNVAGGVQLQLPDYPSPAVRELIVNALVHRDFEVTGTIEVEHSPERLMVSSPGGLVYGVTPENILTHPSTPRNRLLMETVTMLQVAERTGQGVDRAYREMLRSGKPPPSYEDHETRVVARLDGGVGNDAFVRFLNSDFMESSLTVDVEILLAIAHLRTHKSITAIELAPQIQRSQGDAHRVLALLADRGLIAPSRRTARQAVPRYALTAEALTAMGRAVAYHRSTGDDRDQKVMEHVDEYGYITNQTLRRLFDLNVYQARDFLKDLQRRGLLQKLDDRSGGRGVRYGLAGGFDFTRRPDHVSD